MNAPDHALSAFKNQLAPKGASTHESEPLFDADRGSRFSAGWHSVIQGDGRSDEAAAAVAYWCDFTREDAEDFVTELRRKWREQVEASLFRSRQLPLDFTGSTDPDNGGRN